LLAYEGSFGGTVVEEPTLLAYERSFGGTVVETAYRREIRVSRRSLLASAVLTERFSAHGRK